MFPNQSSTYFPPHQAYIWEDGSSESDAAYSRLQRFGYSSEKIYRVAGVRDHCTEGTIKPIRTPTVRNTCTMAPWLTFLKVESLRKNHDFTALFKWTQGEGKTLEDALREIAKLFADGGPVAQVDVDRAVKLKWCDTINLIQRTRVKHTCVTPLDPATLEYEAEGDEDSMVISYLDSVSLFFITWRCQGCPDLDEFGIQRVDGHGRPKMGRVKTESRTNFAVTSIQDYHDIRSGIYQKSMIGNSNCAQCGQGHRMESIVIPATTWILIFEGPPAPLRFNGKSMSAMEYRLQLGGVTWKKVYSTFDFGPGAYRTIPGSTARTNFRQDPNFGHILSIQYIKGIAYLQDDGHANGELFPWAHETPNYDPVTVRRTVYIRCPPKPLSPIPTLNPLYTPSDCFPMYCQGPISVVNVPPLLNYVFPMAPSPTVHVQASPLRPIPERSTPYFSLLPLPGPDVPAYFMPLPVNPIYPQLPTMSSMENLNVPISYFKPMPQPRHVNTPSNPSQSTQGGAPRTKPRRPRRARDVRSRSLSPFKPETGVTDSDSVN